MPLPPARYAYLYIHMLTPRINTSLPGVSTYQSQNIRDTENFTDKSTDKSAIFFSFLPLAFVQTLTISAGTTDGPLFCGNATRIATMLGVGPISHVVLVPHPALVGYVPMVPRHHAQNDATVHVVYQCVVCGRGRYRQRVLNGSLLCCSREKGSGARRIWISFGFVGKE